MAVISLSWIEALPEACRHGAVSLGNFDGVHRGHQAIMAETVRQARAVGGPAVAVTFDPHPLQLLRPEQFQPVLTTIARRAELLHEHGADHVLVLQTSPALLHLTAEEFFAQVLRHRLDARAIVEGFNFCFGRNRAGTVQTLLGLGAAAQVHVGLVSPQLHEGKPISSSRVRRELVDGQVANAIALVGRPYQISGTVGHGRHRGQALGFPTANLESIVTLVPGEGVYAVRARVDDGLLPGACNVGPNPTFGEQSRKVEVHLIDFQGDLYGRVLKVDFLDRLRDIRRFDGIDELRKQLQEDVKAARRIFTG